MKNRWSNESKSMNQHEALPPWNYWQQNFHFGNSWGGAASDGRLGAMGAPGGGEPYFFPEKVASSGGHVEKQMKISINFVKSVLVPSNLPNFTEIRVKCSCWLWESSVVFMFAALKVLCPQWRDSTAHLAANIIIWEEECVLQSNTDRRYDRTTGYTWTQQFFTMDHVRV